MGSTCPPTNPTESSLRLDGPSFLVPKAAQFITEMARWHNDASKR